ncbi:MAG: aldo/keto reductase [Opitutus sp.]
MNYQLFGRSGLRVSELCLGTMTFGEDWGWGASQEESRKMFDGYVEAGGNFLDTADGYTGGTSEKMVGEFVRSDRERFVIATKYSFSARPGDANAGGNHRKNLTQALEGSLRRLGVDYIDLYWVHAWDQLTPVEEVMRALDDAVHAGKILYVGVSDMPAWLVARANTLAELRDWTPFIGLQIEYSLIERTVERELIPVAEAFGLSVAAWSPLASGVLSGKYSSKNPGKENEGRAANSDFVQLNDRALRIADEVIAVANAEGHSPAQVALNWLRSKRSVIPIVGARKYSQFEDNLACLGWSLSPDSINRLDRVSEVELGFPHDFLRRPGVRNFLHGGLWDRIRR